MKRALFALISGSFLLAGCGGGGGGGSSSPETATGVFIDEAVEGLTFISGDQMGVTDADGTFTYEIGSDVMFSIGGIVIGIAEGSSIITPVDLVSGAEDEMDSTVTNIARLLQTLDDDGNPDNGILITENVTDAAANIVIDFSLSVNEFSEDGDVQVAITSLTTFTTAGARMLIPSMTAQEHLAGALIQQFSGNYSGTFMGIDDDGAFGGNYTFTIDEGGVLLGNGMGDDGPFSFIGSINSRGNAMAAGASGGVIGEATVFEITINDDGTFTGTFENDVEDFDGTVQGNRD